MKFKNAKKRHSATLRAHVTGLGIISLGCPKNTADMEGLLSGLENVQLVPLEQAEIILLNTCGFLKKARMEVYENLRRIPKKQKLIVLGCLAGQFKPAAFKKYPAIRAIVSSAHYQDLPTIFKQVKKGKRIYAVDKEPTLFEELPGKSLLFLKSYAYIKIAEGCDNRCSYCLIPSLKGRYRSRKTEDILEEIKGVLSLGVKEIILVAQDCGLYGIDLYKKKTLATLLQKIVKLKSHFWVRLLYLYPEHLEKDLVETLASSPKICHYLDIPLQHGDPEILKAMNRPNNVPRLLQKIDQLRRDMPDITLRTSLIVGFPRETKKQFENLKQFVERIAFDHVGVFEYSRESGTPAYALKPQIAAYVKKERRAILMKLQQKISFANNQKQVGKTIPALIDEFDPEAKIYLGRSMRFAPEIDGHILIQSKKRLKLREIYPIKIEKADVYDLKGKA